MIGRDFLTTQKVFLLTLFVPITLTFFHTFLSKLPRTDAPIHGVSEKNPSRKLRYGFTSGRYGVICGAVLAPTTSNIMPRPTRTRPGRVAARVRLNRPDLRRSCITVR